MPLRMRVKKIFFLRQWKTEKVFLKISRQIFNKTPKKWVRKAIAA
jgi:hypothetical protein